MTLRRQIISQALAIVVLAVVMFPVLRIVLLSVACEVIAVAFRTSSLIPEHISLQPWTRCVRLPIKHA